MIFREVFLKDNRKKIAREYIYVTSFLCSYSDRLTAALRAQEDAESQTKAILQRMALDTEERNQLKQTEQELVHRIENLEKQIQQEAKLRQELEQAQERLEIKNKQLKRVSKIIFAMLFFWIAQYFCLSCN